jgi:putative transposase
MLEKDNPEMPLKTQADLLGISYSSLFYEPVPPSARELAIKRRIDEIYTACPFYGSRKIAVQLRPEFGVSRPTVQAYMREMGIFALVPGPHTSKPAPQHQIYPYLLRNVTATRPNHIWGIDITYIRLQHGWLYLTAVLDWYSRYVVSWALSQTSGDGVCAHRCGQRLVSSQTRNLEQRSGQSLHQPEIFGTPATRRNQNQHGWTRARHGQYLHRKIVAHHQVRRSLSA